MKNKPSQLVLVSGALPIILSGCIANNFCGSSDQPKYIPGVSAIEIVEANKIRVTKEIGAPVHFVAAEGNAIESNILGVSDRIVLRDEHYGADFRIINITHEIVSFDAHEGWSYPVSGWCNPGQNKHTFKLKPYNTHNKPFEQTVNLPR